MRDGFEPRWDREAAKGDQGELFARWAEDGMRSATSLEIKTDSESWATGNVYIERLCFKSDQWVPSGIDHQHTKAEMWAHVVVGPIVIFAPTAFVRRVAEKYGRPRELTQGRNPTKGLIIPIPQFVAELVATGRAWVRTDGRPPLAQDRADPEAPFGRDAKGIPVAPWGYTVDRKVRLQPGGRRAGGKAVPDELPIWGEPGYRSADGYDPMWAEPPDVPNEECDDQKGDVA